MNRKFTFCALLIFQLFLINSYVFSADIETTSPSGNITISFKLDNYGTPYYRVSFENNDMLNWSKLGLNFKSSGMLSSGFKVLSIERNSIDETFPIISGKSRYSRNYCNETKITLGETNGSGRKIDIYFRAYDDGAAFRYGIPLQDGFSEFVLSTEESYFNFAGDYTCWAMKKDRFKHSYEGEYRKYNLSNIDNSPGDSTSFFPYITLPLTMKVSKESFLCLTEAAIVDYAGMYLVKEKGFTLKSKLSPDLADNNISVKGKTPAVTPWRVFIIGNRPGVLIESTLLLNLNQPTKLQRPDDWIKPGRSTWSWWAEERGFDPSFGYQILANNTVKYYIDFASANGIEYVTLDGGWYGWFMEIREDLIHDITKSLPELDLPMIAAYAKQKGVGLILWVVWFELERQFEEALNYYESLGIKGIKVDFMDRDDQYMTDFYKRTAEACAKRKMFVTFHGAYKPDGLSRTYPNILSYEGVLGNEYARWITGLPNPDYYVTLPFTRMVAGPMDYTPGSMTNSTEEAYIGRWKLPMTKGTRASQMAMLVVFESGIVSLCESPKIYEKLPEFSFIKQVPATWDSTIVLGGEIGDYAVIARKNGNKWFVGALTDWNAREVEIDLGFLGPGNFKAEYYTDAPDADSNPGNVKITSEKVTSSDSRTFRLAKGGGLGIVFVRN